MMSYTNCPDRERTSQNWMPLLLIARNIKNFEAIKQNYATHSKVSDIKERVM